MHPIGSVSWKALSNTPRMLMSYNVNGTPTEKHRLTWVEISIRGRLETKVGAF